MKLSLLRLLLTLPSSHFLYYIFFPTLPLPPFLYLPSFTPLPSSPPSFSLLILNTLRSWHQKEAKSGCLYNVFPDPILGQTIKLGRIQAEKTSTHGLRLRVRIRALRGSLVSQI